jgi:hypothetical protein
MNNQPGTNGNDVSIDDIEVRLCAPAVTTNIAGNDTIVCDGNNLNIIRTYEIDCTFGNELAYRWEFRHVDSSSWKPIPTGTGTTTIVDCSISQTITKTVSLTSATKANEGYYRMLVSSPASIERVNCRAASDSVYVYIIEKFVAPDIRIQVCPSPPNHTIQLTKYLDSTDYNRVKWEHPLITNVETGLIYDKVLYKNNTYTLKYTLMSPEHSGCGSTSAKVYIRTLNDRIFGKTVDTITICSALATSRFVNLNQIFGLELGGVWTYPNPDNVVHDNIKEHTSPSKYEGAIVFNAQKAYNEAGSVYDYGSATVKKFDFVYTMPSSSCVNGTKRVTLIVTQ